MSARHAPAAEEVAPFVPGDAVADMHAHTTRSDGVLEPTELVRQAHEAGVRLFAIADHDNLAGYRELVSSGAPPLPPGMDLVPAVEINAVTAGLPLDLPEGEVHVLGIGVDPADEAFEADLAGQRAARRTRFLRTVDRLREIGLPVDEQVAAIDLGRDDALGRPTLARALVRAGFAESVEDAFQRILGHGQPGYVLRTGLGPVEAIHAIRAAGGLAALAHFWDAPDRVSLLRELMAEGLDGLETHHRSFDPETRARMSAIARALGLVETGGTDYHGDLGPYAESHAGLVMPDELVAGLRAALGLPAWPVGAVARGSVDAPEPSGRSLVAGNEQPVGRRPSSSGSSAARPRD